LNYFQERDVFFAAFDAAHVGAIQVTKKRKLFLGNSLPPTLRPDGFAKAAEDGVTRARHAATIIGFSRICRHRVYPAIRLLSDPKSSNWVYPDFPKLSRNRDYPSHVSKYNCTRGDALLTSTIASSSLKPSGSSST
jgi:hypothetical protein